MKFSKYLIHKQRLLLFYLILMSFISSVIYLDTRVKVNVYNILYLNGVSLIFFLIYIIIEYLLAKKYYENINNMIENREENIVNCLPEPRTYEQNLYNQILKNLISQKNSKIEKLHEDKKGNLEFITSWVHEIKNPIAVIRLIIENNKKKSLEEILNSIEEEIDKIDNYVEHILYHSRIDAFSKDYFISDISLDKIVKEVVRKHAKTFINKKIKINIKDTDLVVSSDRKWLMFIINQILSNALKYTPEKGIIKINFEKDDTEKRIIIEDNGIGIKKEDIGRVFDKGFTGHTGRNFHKSTGMGLYLAKQLSNRLGHDITIESSFGEYTKTIIHFPKLLNYYNVVKK
ncbi:sensor histidine kinase GraS [Clostridium tepidiprofundi DSM 19306]|uniref:histidine kinase n=1 Tax=Clostridium tepidiprofundi DSM 19306 TaxID=1121338 RepID=A0A151B4K5_9CLOT|nr:sensor histidine kinase [Clostridium tepidiprofundi]KYH34692.1 sensor histidine kinase GraS [Clostridium tepidiprofundi DSM 19306]